GPWKRRNRAVPNPIVAADVLDLLTALTDNSLVQVRTTAAGEIRYSMLETLRQYTTERLLDPDAERRLRDRHFEYFAGLVRRCEPLLESPAQIDTLDRLKVEHNNLRIADERRAPAELPPESRSRSGTPEDPGRSYSPTT